MEPITAPLSYGASELCVVLSSGWGGPNVPTPEDYEEYALKCLRLAECATDPGHKAFLLEMAQAWIKFSEANLGVN
jgi:hypothetical protein